MLEVTSSDEQPAKSAVSNRSIKSAPLKRRIKSCKRRTFSIASKDDGFVRGRAKGGKVAESKVTDVVTMVSLISSADSESEGEDDKLIHELRNKLPTAPIIKSSGRPATGDRRRPIKSGDFERLSHNSVVWCMYERVVQ